MLARADSLKEGEGGGGLRSKEGREARGGGKGEWEGEGKRGGKRKEGGHEREKCGKRERVEPGAELKQRLEFGSSGGFESVKAETEDAGARGEGRRGCGVRSAKGDKIDQRMCRET